jgi:DNA-3-methyladenine glycosylase II
MFKDPILNALVKKYNAPKFEDRSEKLYEELVESIIGQQLSGKAADTIFKRFLALYNNSKFPNPEELLKTDNEKLRSAGMSYSKASYIKTLLRHLKKIYWKLKKLKN